MRPSELNRRHQAARERAAALESAYALLVRAVLDEAAETAVRRFREAAPRGAVTAAAPTSLSTMVAVFPLPDEAAALAQPGGEPASILHCTLAFLGELDDAALGRVERAMRQVAVEHVPREGKVGGIGTFGVERDFDNEVLYPSIALPDVPGLTELRHAVVKKLEEEGVEFSREHDFNPHLTLAYTPEPTLPAVDVLGLPLSFRFLTVARGDVPVHIGLTGPLAAAGIVYDGDDETAIQVAEVAERHAPVDGYGDTYWHARVSADWSSNDECDAAVADFLAVDGVREVEVCAECGAPAGDGWELVYGSEAGGNAAAVRASLLAAATRPAASGGLTAASPPDWRPPSGSELVDVDSLAALLRARTETTRSALIESVMRSFLDGVGVAWDVTNPLIAKALNSTGRHIVGIAQGTRERVQRAVDAAYREGLSIPNAAELIRSQMLEANDARATLIARTELVGAVNSASLSSVEIVSDVTGLGYVKVWMTAPGAEFPRHEEYDDLDGQTVELDAYFDVGGNALLYPGDEGGPPEDVCNCRCTLSYEEAGASSG